MLTSVSLKGTTPTRRHILTSIGACHSLVAAKYKHNLGSRHLFAPDYVVYYEEPTNLPVDQVHIILRMICAACSSKFEWTIFSRVRTTTSAQLEDIELIKDVTYCLALYFTGCRPPLR